MVAAANSYLHPEEGDTGQEVHGGFEVLQPVFAASREVVLHGGHSGGGHTTSDECNEYANKNNEKL